MNSSGRKTWPIILASGVVFMATLFVYVSTLQPSVGDLGDSVKFQLIAPTLGVPHATGYPLYTLLAKVVTLVPIGNVAYRVNLLSAMAAAGASAGVTAIVWRLASDIAVASVVGLVFGFSPTLWSQATIAEVYTLHAAFVVWLVFFLALWYSDRRALWLVFALGCGAAGLGNHATMTLWLLPVAAFIWIVDRRSLLTWKMGAALAGGVFFVVVQYAWLFVRARHHPPFCEYCPDTPPRLIWYLRGAQFQSRFFGFPATVYAQRVVGYLGLASAELGFVVVLAGFAGLVILMLGARWKWAVFFVLALVMNLGFSLGYDIVDYENYLIPSYVIILILAGITLGAVKCHLLAYLEGTHGRGRYGASAVWWVFLAWLVVPTAIARYPLMDQSSNRWAADYSADLLGLIPTDGVLVDPPCCDFYSRAMAVVYQQQVVGFRQDVLLYKFNPIDLDHLHRPSYLPMGQDTIPILDLAGERRSYLPQVGRITMETLAEYLTLKPVDTSDLGVSDVLAQAPPGSIVLMASRQPVPWIVDPQMAEEMSGLLRHFGFASASWPGLGAHILVGVADAEPGTAVELIGQTDVSWHVREGEVIGSTGVRSPLPMKIVSSLSDVDVVVGRRNLSGHQWGYQLIILEPDSGEVLVRTHFDTETFLAENIRAYHIAEVHSRDGSISIDPKAWYPPSLVLKLSDPEVAWYLGDGWSAPESWGAWAEGLSSHVRISLPTNASYVMHLTAKPLCLKNHHTAQAMSVSWNGTKLTDLSFDGCDMQGFDVRLPNMWGNMRVSHLRFDYDVAVSPFDLTQGANMDRRSLSVGFESIEFVPTGHR